jgi:hypothetical protein
LYKIYGSKEKGKESKEGKESKAFIVLLLSLPAQSGLFSENSPFRRGIFVFTQRFLSWLVFGPFCVRMLQSILYYGFFPKKTVWNRE